MLKVEDDFNLKQLQKKYGFKHPREILYEYCDKDTTIIINKRLDNIVELMIDYDEDSAVCSTSLDILYDLIKDGILKKVSDKK